MVNEVIRICLYPWIRITWFLSTSALRSISYCIRMYVTDTVRSTEVRYYSVHTMISLSPTYVHRKLCTFQLGYNDVSLPQSQIAVSKLPLYPESYTEGLGIIYSIALYPDARIVKPARGWQRTRNLNSLSPQTRGLTYVLLLESTYEPQISLKKLTKLNESEWFLWWKLFCLQNINGVAVNAFWSTSQIGLYSVRRNTGILDQYRNLTQRIRSGAINTWTPPEFPKFLFYFRSYARN